MWRSRGICVAPSNSLPSCFLRPLHHNLVQVFHSVGLLNQIYCASLLDTALYSILAKILHSILWAPYATTPTTHHERDLRQQFFGASSISPTTMGISKAQAAANKKAQQKKSRLTKWTLRTFVVTILAVVGYFLDGIKVSSTFLVRDEAVF